MNKETEKMRNFLFNLNFVFLLAVQFLFYFDFFFLYFMKHVSFWYSIQNKIKNYNKNFLIIIYLLDFFRLFA